MNTGICLLVMSISAVFCFVNVCMSNKMSSGKLFSVEFEVYGRVQGVFFRKYTQQESKKLGLRGWCMNTIKGTVQGVLEGDETKIKDMKYWLHNTGSPSSRIEKADFKNEKEISQYSFSNFTIKQ